MLQHAKAIPIDQNSSAPLWTQQESIDFECAKETVGHMIAICSSLIADEKQKKVPNFQRITELENKRSLFTKERRELRLKNSKEVERINRDYGTKIKTYLKENGACPV
jgi:hypothetical protein